MTVYPEVDGQSTHTKAALTNMGMSEDIGSMEDTLPLAAGLQSGGRT